MNEPQRSAVRIPHIPGPPFEPGSLLLDQRTGWRAEPAAWSGVEAVAAMLRLVPDPAGARSVTEPSGSFGGLVPPSHVALGSGGELVLLDRSGYRLRRFDRCRCLFSDLPCTGGKGGGAREWREPGGVAICGDRLYVCDGGNGTGKGRVSVFSLGTLALYGHLAPPDGAPWQPVAVAVDPSGRAWVSDALNGRVHGFSPALRHVRSLPGFSQPGAIAVDACGLLYLLEDAPGGGRRLRIVDADGHEQTLSDRIDVLAHRFPALPFGVDAQGRLDLRPLCIGAPGIPGTGPLVFDEHGEPVLSAPAPNPVRFLAAGTLTIGPLDSRTHACIWHRALLHGRLPQATRIRLESFTAEEIIPANQLADFARWETGQVASLFEDGRWDCLLRSGAGRYLWLRLHFLGDGWSTPELDRIEIEFPRIGPRQYLPAVFGAEGGSVDFTDRFLALFDTTWRGIEDRIDRLPGLFDPMSAPAQRVGAAPVDFLGWLASWVGLGVGRNWDEADRRRLLKQAGRALDRRGTLPGLRASLALLLGLDRGAACACPDEPRVRCGSRPANCAVPAVQPPAWTLPPLVLEHFRVRRWLYLGQGRLGERSVLWGQRIVNRSQLGLNAQADVTQLVARPDPLHDPFHSHAHQFTVFVPACVRDDEARRKALENLLAADSPAHTRHYIEYVEPRFRIGVQSTLGFDAVVAAPPRTHALGEQPLGTGVLGPSPRAGAGGRRWEIGVTSRIN